MNTAATVQRLPQAHGSLSGRHCEGCGDWFTPRRRHQVNCSPRCRLAAFKARHTGVDPAKLIGRFVWCRDCRRLVPLPDVAERTAEGGYVCRACSAVTASHGRI